MNHIELTIALEPFKPFNEIVIAQLGELPFDSFTEEEDEKKIKAYILKDDFEENAVKGIFSELESMVSIQYEVTEIEKVNWNQKWEENFDSVEVGSFCYVRAPFHEAKPAFQHEIIIEPKMSFGTGHHQTTQMMIELMEDIDFEGKTVLDMGSGTGILAILAKKMGAAQVEAIDIEDWAFENMKENFERNGVEANAYLGDVDLIDSIALKYDVIIANINKNILLRQFATYDFHLKDGALLLLSGFYETDSEDLVKAKDLPDYSLIKQLTKETWCALKLQKCD